MKASKLLIVLITGIFLSINVNAQDTVVFKLNFEKSKKIKVGFLVYNGVEAQDLNGPLDVFVKANRISGNFDIYLISATSSKQIKTEAGIVEITAQFSIDDAPQSDILIVPGAAPDVINNLALNNNALKNWMLSQNKNTTVTASVCTGSLYLASVGMLTGFAATTHPACITAMKQIGGIDVKENVRFVLDRKYITGSGITSGIDVALKIVELINGKQSADMIANIMVYNRNGDLSFMNK